MLFYVFFTYFYKQSKIHCDGDIDLCHIQINKNAMIDGYIECNDNVSNCIVDIISEPKQTAMKSTIFEWYVS